MKKEDILKWTYSLEEVVLNFQQWAKKDALILKKILKKREKIKQKSI